MKTNFLLIGLLRLTMAANGRADGDKKGNKGPQAGGQDNPAAQPNAGGGGPGQRQHNDARQQGPNGFDSSTFAATMIQQFDRDSDGGLNQAELGACLAMLSQQVIQEKQMIAQAAQQQTRGQNVASGQLGGQAGQNGCAPGQDSAGPTNGGSFSANAGARGGAGGAGGRAGGGAGGRGGGPGGGAGGRGGGR